MLVRLVSARVPTTVTSLGSGQYRYTYAAFYHAIFGCPRVFKVERNGTALTEVSSTPTNNDEWEYDAANDYLNIKLASAPNTTTNVITYYCYLHLTDQIQREYYEDPDDSNSAEVTWWPMLIEKPNVSQTIEDTFQGIVTVGASTLEIEDTGYIRYSVSNKTFLKKYYCANDYYKLRDAEIWLGFDGNYQKIYKGKCVDTSGARGEFSVDLKAPNVDLQKRATLNVTETYQVYRDRNVWTKVEPGYLGKPIPFFFKNTRHAYKTDDSFMKIIYDTGSGSTDYTAYGCYYLDHENTERLVNIDYQKRTTGNNKTYGGHRCSAFKRLTDYDDDIVNPRYWKNFGSPSATDPAYGVYYHGTSNYHPILTFESDSSIFEIGDCLLVNETSYDSGVSKYAIIMQKIPSADAAYDDFIEGGSSFGYTLAYEYRCIVFDNDGSVPPTITSGIDISDAEIVAVNHPAYLFVAEGDTYPHILPPINGIFINSNYATDPYTTHSDYRGDAYGEHIYLDFQDNFESYLLDSSLSGGLNPDTDFIYYRATEDSSNWGHANVVKYLHEAASDATVNSASITAAQSALNVDVSMTIPLPGDDDVQSYAYYLGKILESTIGYIYYNTSGEAVYELIDTFSSTRDVYDYEIIAGSFSIERVTSDIINELTLINPNIPDWNDLGLSDLTVNNTASQFLNADFKYERREHVLEDISGRSSTLIDWISNGICVVEFKIFVDLWTYNIGDMVTLNLKRTDTDTTYDQYYCRIISMDLDGDIITIRGVTR